MSRIIIVFCLLVASSIAHARRNVVLLISDNQNQDDCGCYGNPVVKTPNIDALARQGIRFLDAFATTASCGPSRAVIYTGLQTHANGQYGHGHGIHTYRLSPKVETVFARLKDIGYHTALLGKQHTTHPDSYPFTFNRKVSGRDVTGLANTAKQFIEQAGDEPFFLTIGFSDPHPTSIERPGWGIVRKDDSVPKVVYSDADVIVPDYLPDRVEVREGLAGYYQEISRLDHGVGLIMRVLRETKKHDETLVIFTSDHGSSEPGAMANHYEPGIRVPFIISSPDTKAAGVPNSAMVTLADITPTILDWTGADTGREMHGRSVLPVLDLENVDGWDQVLLSHVCHEVTMYYPMRTIRNRRYKLIWNIDWRSEYPLPIDTLRRATWTEAVRRGDPAIGKRSIRKYLFRDQIELYDLQDDPDEIMNLADVPELQKQRRELSTKLITWLESTDDPWLVRHRLPMPGQSESKSSRQADLDDDEQYRAIFNGKDLSGWTLRRSDRGGYRVEDGLLVCPADGGGYLFTEQDYDNFCLRFDFRLTAGANNGVAIRSPLVEAKPAYEGMEFQIIDNRGFPAKLKPTQYHGSLYGLAAAKRGALRPVGQWNHQQIWCNDRRVVVTLNDVVVLDENLDRVADEKTRALHPGLSRRTGRIGLLGHGSRVEFRNLQVKKLSVPD